MSGLNTYFIPLTILQEQFWDKVTDAPLAGGKLYFFQDEARTIPKPVYVLTGSPPDYTYEVASPSATAITLSSIGTVNDGSGNNLVIYGYPYDDSEFDGSGNIQLYYMSVYDSDGSFQFSVGGFPNVPFEEVEQASGHEKNFIKNGQFVLNAGAKSIAATSIKVAYGGWYYVRSSNTATDAISFTRFGSPIEGGSPSANPRYSCNVSCTVTGTDSYKALEIKFNDVNRFSDTVQTLSLFFEAKSTVGSAITVDLYKYFGSGGSSPISEQIVESTVLDSTWTPVTTSFAFGSNVGKTLGANNDDYFSIRVMFPPATTFNVSLADFCMFLGSEQITEYPFGTDSYNDAQIVTTFNTVNVKTFATSGTYTPTEGMNYCTIECWGGGGGGGSAKGTLAYNESMGAGGGGAGGYSRKTVSASTIGASQTVTIGTGGAGGASGANNVGISGTATSIGSICIANGGSGGGTVASAGGNGGVAGTGDIAAPGQCGGVGFYSTTSAVDALGGAGGNTMVGSGGSGRLAGYGVALAGVPGTGYGSGGSAACVTYSTSGAAGGNGTGGLAIITEFMFVQTY
jgi:hypothetical protein